MTSKKAAKPARSPLSRPLASSPEDSDPFVTPTKASATDRVVKSSTKKRPYNRKNKDINTPTKQAAGRLYKLELESAISKYKIGGRKALGMLDFRVGASKDQKPKIIYSEDADDHEENAAFLGYESDEDISDAYDDDDNDYDNEDEQPDQKVKIEEHIGPHHPSVPQSLITMENFRDKAARRNRRLGLNPNGRTKGRKLVMWHRDRMMEKLLLNLQYECHLAGIKLPWDAAVHRLNPGSAGTSAVQMLNKVRDQLIMEGHMIPPTMGKGHDYDDTIRGFVRDMNGARFTTTQTVYWKDKCDNRKVSLMDHGMVRGSGKYRQAEVLGIQVTKVPRTLAQRQGIGRNLIPQELRDEMTANKKIKDSISKSALKRGHYNQAKPRVGRAKRVKSDKFVKSEDEDEEDEDFSTLDYLDSDSEYSPSGRSNAQRKNSRRAVTLDQELENAFVDESQSPPRSSIIHTYNHQDSLKIKLSLAPNMLAQFPPGSGSGFEVNDDDDEDNPVRNVMSSVVSKSGGMNSSHSIRAASRSIHQSSQNWIGGPPQRALSASSSSVNNATQTRNNGVANAIIEVLRADVNNRANQITIDTATAHNFRNQTPSGVIQQEVTNSSRFQPAARNQNEYAQQESMQISIGGNRHAEDDPDWVDDDETMVDPDEIVPMVDNEAMPNGTNTIDGYAVTYENDSEGQIFAFGALPAAQDQTSIFEGTTHGDHYEQQNPQGNFVYVRGQIYDDGRVHEDDEELDENGLTATEAAYIAGAWSPGADLRTQARADQGAYNDEYDENTHHSGRTLQEQGYYTERNSSFDDGGAGWNFG